MAKQYTIPSNHATEDFFKCWQAAVTHIEAQGGEGIFSWLRVNLSPPLLEHLAFRIGNQLFFIHVTDDLGTLPKPSRQDAAIYAAEMANGVPCVIVMRRTLGGWEPLNPGWGLTHAVSGEPVSPLDLVSDEKIEMSDWELRDFAIQVVRDHLKEESNSIIGWCSNTEIDPQIWFTDENGKMHFVVVRAVRYPETEASIPVDIDDIVVSCGVKSNSGFFASVGAGNSEDEFDSDTKPTSALPLWRGHGLFVIFKGLTPLQQPPIQ